MYSTIKSWLRYAQTRILTYNVVTHFKAVAVFMSQLEIIMMGSLLILCDFFVWFSKL